MKKIEMILVSVILIICTSYNQPTEKTLDNETLKIRESLDKTEQGIIELEKILKDPYYKYKIK